MADLLMHELVERQALRTPHRIAAVAGTAQLTYGELESRANRLARHLLRLGVRLEDRVGVLLEHDFAIIYAMLAILKCGAAYVPFDPTVPASRNQIMAEECGLSLVLTLPYLQSILPDCRALDISDPAIEAEQPWALSASLIPDNLAYIMFTSGSMGRPKGVHISHRSVANFLRSMQSDPGVTEDDIVLAMSTATFDISLLELVLPLTVGGSVAVVPSNPMRAVPDLVRLADNCRVTLMQTTPTNWRYIVATGWPGRGGLRLLSGGEPIPRALAEGLLARADAVYNIYGPTEATIWCSLCRLQPQDLETPPLGHPLQNNALFLLDDDLRPVASGQTGEIYISGVGLARCYGSASDMTADRFVPNPHSGVSGSRMYRSGDLARLRADGMLEFLGRRDRQIKVMGGRVEPGEIETILEQHPQVHRASVMAVPHASGQLRLCAWIEPRSPVTDKEVRQFLRERLPRHMVPFNFVFVPQMPLTVRGRIDRNALPLPQEAPLPCGRDLHDEPAETTDRCVLINDEEQYGIWPSALPPPEGWRAAGCSGTRAQCMAFVREVWTDQRPLSVRRHMAKAAG